MKARILGAALGLALVSGAVTAETKFASVSATSTVAYAYFTTPRADVMICSVGANKAYFRLFNENDTVAAATTSSTPIVAGTATAPVCISYTKPPTEPANYKAVSVICDTAETATIWIFSN